MTSNEDRPRRSPALDRAIDALGVLCCASFLFFAVDALYLYFWGGRPGGVPTVQGLAVVVGLAVFSIVNVGMTLWTKHGHPREDVRRLLKKNHGLFRWLGSLATAVLSGVITELISSHLHR